LIEIIKYLPDNVSQLSQDHLSWFDMACGTGGYSFPFVNMLLKSNEKIQGVNFTFMLMGASTEVFEKYQNYFNFGMITNAIHHFDVPTFLNTVQGFLKIGGRLFVYTLVQNTYM